MVSLLLIASVPLGVITPSLLVSHRFSPSWGSVILRVLSTWLLSAVEGLRLNTRVQICLGNETSFSSNIKKPADAVAQDWIVGFPLAHIPVWGPRYQLPGQAICPLQWLRGEQVAGPPQKPGSKSLLQLSSGYTSIKKISKLPNTENFSSHNARCDHTK